MSQKGKRAKKQGAVLPASSTESSPNSPPYSLPAALFGYYSSQAKVMLDQYKNINQLLGPTNDWTPSGTLCEVLIRDLIRCVLPRRYSADKGFILGRRKKDNKEIHSPEIDLLIHNSLDYSPVYRLEDFVIVLPYAVKGVIQVKQTLNGGQLKDAIDNLVGAKEHLKASSSVHTPIKYEDIFSAAIFFGDKLKGRGGKVSRTYESTIRALNNVERGLWPHFLGSLEKRFYVASFEKEDQYDGYPSQVVEGNLALVYFLDYLMEYIIPSSYQRLTLCRPGAVTSDQTIQIGTPQGKTKGTRTKGRESNQVL